MGQRIDTLSSTLLAMKDLLMMKNKDKEVEDMKSNSHEHHEKELDRAGNSNDNIEASALETIIYHNALQKDKQSIEVDNEVTFMVDSSKVHRYSTSSDEHIDTSDGLMDVDVDQFIADFSRQAKVQGGTQQEDRDVGVKAQVEGIIQSAEVSKARILATPGENTSPNHS